MSNNFVDIGTHPPVPESPAEDTSARPDVPGALYFRRWQRWVTPDDAHAVVSAIMSRDENGAT